MSAENTIAKQELTNTLVTIPIQEFKKKRNFVSVHKAVRANAKNYPYVPFIDDKNVAENIYFSKASGETQKAGDLIVKGFFAKLQIAEVENADGEKRIKLVGTSTERLFVEDLF